MYAWISHNSKLSNMERYSEKTNYSKDMFSSVTCSLYCFVVVFFFKQIGILHLDAHSCKFTLVQ